MVSVSQHPSVHRAVFFLDALWITPFPAVPGFYVASFLGSEPSFFFRQTTNCVSSEYSSLYFPLTIVGKVYPLLSWG